MSGATPEATIAEKEKTNQNYGDFTRKVASNADAYRERMKEEYQQRSDILKNQIFSLDQQRASQWSNLMGNAANLGVAGIAADSIQKKPEDTGGGGAGARLNSFLASKNPGVMNDINNNPGSSMNGILKKNLINQ
jgi:hypothetical protein